MPHRVALVLLCASLVLLLIGCGNGPELDVAEGQYRLYVEGTLADTLTGPALARAHRNGHVGIELGKPNGPGMSIEVKPPTRPDRSADAPQLSPGRYDVVAASLLESAPADSLSGLVAFLSVADLEFVATQGHLSVTHVDGETVGGRLDVEMVEQESDTPGERTVRVTGVLRATTP